MLYQWFKSSASFCKLLPDLGKAEIILQFWLIITELSRCQSQPLICVTNGSNRLQVFASYCLTSEKQLYELLL